MAKGKGASPILVIRKTIASGQSNSLVDLSLDENVKISALLQSGKLSQFNDKQIMGLIYNFKL